MNLSDFDYNLPKDLIANDHIYPRDHSNLLFFDREKQKIEHKKFYDIVDLLSPNDVLVFNNSKVFRARIFGNKKSGGKTELLLLKNTDNYLWQSLAKGKFNPGDTINLEEGLICEFIEKIDDRVWLIQFNKKRGEIFQYLEKWGELPLPPYIGSKNNELGIKNSKEGFYQNTYADEGKTGSVAAPTAGFHFTEELLEKIKAKGIKILFVTLHVGLGTFLPVEVDDVTKHQMHEEFFEVKKEVWNEMIDLKKEGKNIIAIGTTTTRTLESIAKKFDSELQKVDEDIFDSTKIFVYPPYQFKVINSLITNFHLPKSTLLMLVSAFISQGDIGGIAILKKIYKEAIDHKYRFFSFGDSMFLK